MHITWPALWHITSSLQIESIFGWRGDIHVKRFVIALAAVLLLCCGYQQTASADGPYHFGFKKSKNGQLPSINEEGFKEVLQKNEAIFLGDTSRKELYLTFDNGYENGFTPKILDVLKEKRSRPFSF